MCFLGHGKHISKDSVRVIARFYSRSEYDIKHLNAKLIISTLESVHFGHIMFTSNTHFYGTFVFSDVFPTNQAALVRGPASVYILHLLLLSLSTSTDSPLYSV